VGTDADVIVIGGGVMGTAAARALAERGRATLLIERSRIGHARGSSGGPTRIFRLAYHHPDYVRLARRALRAWRELESRAGEPLLVTTGGVDAGEGSRACAEAMAAAGERFQQVAARAVMERWPALRFDDGATLFVHEDAGVCLAHRTVMAQARLAREAGATLLEGTAVESVRPVPSGVEVIAGDRAHRAPVAVLAAGPWNGPMLRRELGMEISLRPTFEQAAYFALPEPSALPTLVDRGTDPRAPAYAVPNPTEPGTVKVGTHLGGVPVEPDALPEAPDPNRLERDSRYARERFEAEPTGAVDTCMYTVTPDEDFVLDRRESLVVCSPCSGHGFKFAPLIGELVADLVEGRRPAVALDRFGSTRPALAPG
jgi:sarcosine oxidase